MSAPPETARPAESPARLAGELALFAALYAALAEASILLFPPEVGFASFWLPSGLFVAALLREPSRRWPALLAAGCAANVAFDLHSGIGVRDSLVAGLGNALEAWVGAVLVRRLVCERPTLASVREVAALAGFSALLATTISATVGMTTIPASGASSRGGTVWLFWWGGNVLGVLLIAPLILSWARAPWSWVRGELSRRGAEAASLLAVVCTVCTYCFHYAPLAIRPIIFPVIPCVLWAAFRFGMRTTAWTNLVVALLAAWFLARDFSSFPADGISARAHYASLQISLAIVALTGLFMAAVLAERRRSEATLRESEARFRTMLESSPDAVVVHREGTIVYANPAALALLGARDPGQLAGREMLEFIEPEFHGPVRERRRRLAETGARGGLLEMRYVRLDGTRIETESENATILFDGAPATQVTSRDISARKRAAAERLDLERKLQETQKLESLGLLAGGIAHDFNNILTGILGNASLAREDLPPGSPAQASLDSIQQGARRAAELCRQLLAYSGKGRFVVQSVSLNRLVEETLPLLQVSVSKRIALHYDLDPAAPVIAADATQIRQVLMNLVINASEAVADAHGTIRISTGLAPFGPEGLRDLRGGSDLPQGDYALLEVADTGCGMSPETQARIFDPFFTTKFAGRGIGLAAVLGIIRGHKGALKLDSRVGEGTTFTLLFPAVRDAAVAAPEAEGSRDPWRGHGRVLVVDDEETVRTAAARMLGRLGFDVATAVDGLEAVELFRAAPHSFALVLMDLTMPRLDGEEAFQQLLAIRPGVRVVLMSGFSEQEAVSHFAGKGLASFLQKPFEMKELSRIVQRTLGAP